MSQNTTSLNPKKSFSFAYSGSNNQNFHTVENIKMFDVQSKSDDQLTSKTDHRKNEMKQNEIAAQELSFEFMCACLTILFFSVQMMMMMMMMIIVNSVIRLMVNP